MSLIKAAIEAMQKIRNVGDSTHEHQPTAQNQQSEAVRIARMSSQELDVAVAEALGWTVDFDCVGRIDRSNKIIGEVRVTPYSSCIELAWDLDGVGWIWEFIEIGNGIKLSCGLYLSHGLTFRVFVDFVDFTEKAHAYATARCRVWLAAREAINEQG